MDIGERIKHRRKEIGMSADKLAELIGVTRSTVYRYESGDIEKLPLNVLAPIAKALNVSESYLMGWETSQQNIKNLISMPTLNKKIPLLGNISAGMPVLAEENIEMYIDLDKSIKADFCLRVQGDSMINANIRNNDIVFITKQSDVDDGEIAAVLIDDEATLKRVYKIGDVVQLRAENPKYQPITLNGDNEVLILGKATYKLSEIL